MSFNSRYVLGEHDEISAFVITTTNVDPFLHVPMDFELWIGWSGKAGLLDEMESEIEKVALARGCTGIQHTSPRLAWGRRTKRMGYRIRNIVWRKPLVEE